MDSLINHSNSRAVRNALEVLPAEVNATYDIAMERIKSQGEADRKLAERVLSWITYAYKPLSLQMLQHALAVFPGMTVIDPDAFEHELILTSVCVGLVVINEQSNIIRLVRKQLSSNAQIHLKLIWKTDHTAQEYFEAKRVYLFPHAQADIATTCLTYLSLDAFGMGSDLELSLGENSLFHYAASYWGRHAQGETEECIAEVVLAFLKKTTNVARASQVLMRQKQYRRDRDFRDNFSGMHLLSFFGLGKVIHRQIQDDVTANSKDIDGRSPLLVATEYGQDSAVRVLAANEDVDMNLQDRCGRTALSHAAGRGIEKVMRLLLARKDLDVNLQDEKGQTPLFHATQCRNNKVAELLLAREDVEVNIKDMSGRTPLSHAVVNGNDEMVRLLLAREDVEVNMKDWYGRTPLFHAVINGNDEMVELLLAWKNVEVNMKDWCGRTPLFHAVVDGNGELVRLLLTREDVDVSMKDDSRRTPLSHAMACGNNEMVRLLLAREGLDKREGQDGSDTTLLGRRT